MNCPAAPDRAAASRLRLRRALRPGPLPPRPIERGRPGPGLPAHVLTAEYAGHLPLLPRPEGRTPEDQPSGFRGWMHADGYAGFEDLCRAGDIREVACLAHVRRKFVDVRRA